MTTVVVQAPKMCMLVSDKSDIKENSAKVFLEIVFFSSLGHQQFA